MEKLNVNESIRPSDCIYLSIICEGNQGFYDCEKGIAKHEYGNPFCRGCSSYKSISEYNKEMKHKKELEKLKENLLELRNLIGFNGNNCNLTTCRYNQSGTCANEDKREECVEVSKRVLCLEDRK